MISGLGTRDVYSRLPGTWTVERATEGGKTAVFLLPGLASPTILPYFSDKESYAGA
jgi:hypothetical protein